MARRRAREDEGAGEDEGPRRGKRARRETAPVRQAQEEAAALQARREQARLRQTAAETSAAAWEELRNRTPDEQARIRRQRVQAWRARQCHLQNVRAAAERARLRDNQLNAAQTGTDSANKLARRYGGHEYVSHFASLPIDMRFLGGKGARWVC